MRKQGGQRHAAYAQGPADSTRQEAAPTERGPKAGLKKRAQAWEGGKEALPLQHQSEREAQ
eukprot:10483766-Alexandrium_andersonii.AAC.1